MVSLLRKLTDEGEECLLLGRAALIAANANGAWTPYKRCHNSHVVGRQLSTIAVMRADMSGSCFFCGISGASQ